MKISTLLINSFWAIPFSIGLAVELILLFIGINGINDRFIYLNKTIHEVLNGDTDCSKISLFKLIEQEIIIGILIIAIFIVIF